MSDFINEGQSTRYMIHADAKEELNINVHIQEGDAEVQVSNLNTVNLIKKSNGKNRIIHFSIKHQSTDDNSTSNGLINPTALSNLITIYHLTIKSIDSSKACTFTVSYSSGKR